MWLCSRVCPSSLPSGLANIEPQRCDPVSEATEVPDSRGQATLASCGLSFTPLFLLCCYHRVASLQIVPVPPSLLLCIAAAPRASAASVVRHVLSAPPRDYRVCAPLTADSSSQSSPCARKPQRCLVCSSFSCRRIQAQGQICCGHCCRRIRRVLSICSHLVAKGVRRSRRKSLSSLRPLPPAPRIHARERIDKCRCRQTNEKGISTCASQCTAHLRCFSDAPVGGPRQRRETDSGAHAGRRGSCVVA